MPYIGTRTTVEVSAEKGAIVKAKLGKAIECIPGKSEAWLMVEIEGGCHIWMKGDNSKPSAFVDVRVFGSAKSEDYEKLTVEICTILSEELGVPSDRIYITYSGYSEWGWNNMNF